MTAKFKLKDKFTKKTITQNIGLKLMSLAVAVILWFIVVNLTDPVITQTYKNVPVRILNADIITDNAKTLEVVDEYYTTQLARKEYWQARPPKGWRRLLPVSMQVPPEPVDDFVAVLLAQRYLNSRRK